MSLTLLVVLLILPPFLLVQRQASPGREAPPSEGKIKVKIYDDDSGTSREIPLEEYLVGVVAAEMPASFHLEALKAQAVVARTYAVDHLRVFGGEGCRNGKADLCTDPTVNQGWISDQEMREKWGLLGYWRLKPKIEKAVADTRGLIVTYRGEPIDAVYHSAAGGKTTAAKYVWGNEIPYLKSVSSPYEERSPYNEVRTEFSLAELAEKLQVEEESLRETVEEGGSLFSQARRSPSGRVVAVKVAGREFSGGDLRRLLGLNSARLDWEVGEDGVVITTAGNGHGVGMSQYGADGFARNGYDFRQIIEHYYPGVKIKPIFAE